MRPDQFQTLTGDTDPQNTNGHLPANKPEKESIERDDAQREIVASRRTPGSRYVRYRPSRLSRADEARRGFVSVSAPALATGKPSLFHRVMAKLVGAPIPTEEAIHERIGIFKALAVLSSDALSSVAYGTEASLAVLVTAGYAALTHNLLLGLMVILLLATVAFSYRQTIYHYPNGGGSYIVSKENLNVHFGLIAAASILIDYVLTVSVSISAGVDALISSFSGLKHIQVELGIALIVLMVIVNLRGVRESGSIFAAPTYLFVGSFLLMIGVGVARAIFSPGGILRALPAHPSSIIPQGATAHLTLFLVLTAFASGCSAMTGTEAISDGVPVFKEPRAKNAAQTLTLMAALLAVMYGGTTFLAWRFGITPQANSDPTVIHQLAATFFTGGFGWFTVVFDFITTAILVLAANTAFADFPRLSSILARDDFMPHVFGMQGDRLAFNTGIFVLGVLAGILLIVFHGNTDALINLYALGVFSAFTLSQSGMVRRWLRLKEPGWHYGLPINLLGAIVTGIVTLIIAVSKFDRGAWVVIILIPLLYAMFQSIHHHYARVREEVEEMPVRKPGAIRHLMVVPISGVDNLALRGLAYARNLTPYVLAVHVATSPEDAERVRETWEAKVRSERFLRGGPANDDYGDEEGTDGLADDIIGNLTGPELVLIDSPYRALVRPIIDFIDTIQKKHPNDVITVVLPEFVTTHFWESILHNQTVLRLKLALLTRSHIVTTNVPYSVKHHPEQQVTP